MPPLPLKHKGILVVREDGDTFVFEGYRQPSKGGKRLPNHSSQEDAEEEHDPTPPVNWPRLITFLSGWAALAEEFAGKTARPHQMLEDFAGKTGISQGKGVRQAIGAAAFFQK